MPHNIFAKCAKIYSKLHITNKCYASDLPRPLEGALSSKALWLTGSGVTLAAGRSPPC